MSVTAVVLPDSSEDLVCIGFAVKFDSESPQLDAIYKALKGIQGSRVEYMDSKKFRADLPVKAPK